MRANSFQQSDQRQSGDHTIFSFFSGCGLLDLGFEHEGFDVAFVNELQPSFLGAYLWIRRRMKLPLPRYGFNPTSIEDLVNDPILAAMMAQTRRRQHTVGFIAGPSCPDFSTAGNGAGATGDRGRLTRIYFELIASQRPDWWLFENVRGLYIGKNRKFFEEMKYLVQAAGYATDERLLNSLSYGCAQDRDRIILVGVRQDRQSSLELPWDQYTTHQKPFDLPWPTTSEFGGSTPIKPAEIPEELTVGHWFKRNKVDQHPNRENGCRPRGDMTKYLTIAEGDISGRSFKRLHRHRYSPTACFGHNEVYLHPWLPRRLNVAETLAIQSAPAVVTLPPSMTLTDMYQTVGNAVPYLLAKSLAKMVKEQVLEKLSQRPHSLRENQRLAA